jgi:hypothetical protein
MVVVSVATGFVNDYVWTGRFRTLKEGCAALTLGWRFVARRIFVRERMRSSLIAVWLYLVHCPIRINPATAPITVR